MKGKKITWTCDSLSNKFIPSLRRSLSMNCFCFWVDLISWYSSKIVCSNSISCFQSFYRLVSWYSIFFPKHNSVFIGVKLLTSLFTMHLQFFNRIFTVDVLCVGARPNLSTELICNGYEMCRIFENECTSFLVKYSATNQLSSCVGRLSRMCGLWKMLL